MFLHCALIAPKHHVEFAPLQKYHSMDPTAKKEIIKKYMENGPKNMQWAAGYVEKTSSSSMDESMISKGWFTKKQILEMNGVSTQGLDQKTADGILQELLDTFYKEHSIDPTGQNLIQDSKFEQLKKYYYEHFDKILQKDITQTTTEMSVSSSGLKIEQCKNMLADAAGSGCIKLENPAHVEMVNQAKIVTIGKEKLQKEHMVLMDLLAQIAQNGKHKTVVSEFEKKLQVISDFITLIRNKNAQTNKVDGSDNDGCQKVLGEWKIHQDHMVVHMEGAKSMKKAMQALL